nr:MAG TPA: hypothetical protein [Caudoviricetes sp.]
MIDRQGFYFQIATICYFYVRTQLQLVSLNYLFVNK